MKKKIIIGIIILLVLVAIGISLFFLFRDEEEPEVSDAQKFASEYTQVTSDNVFLYRNASEIIRILENGTGVVYLGFPECKWCQRYVKYLNEVAYEEDIEKLYYYNIKEDRENNTENYQKIIEILGDYVPYDEEGNKKIYVPAVIYVKNGEIVGHDNESSMVSGDVDEYWTEEKVSALKERTREFMKASNPNICTDGCNG